MELRQIRIREKAILRSFRGRREDAAAPLWLDDVTERFSLKYVAEKALGIVDDDFGFDDIL